ncbi:winged helix-turn-helix transcriptional regulator [Methanohalophilus sp.]|uniref:winged helix-turn-helix transcriptional regulator n=1 Tax=Methanohalophilus sp. TaxID=1966352 RepID=UPI002607A864|nr:winged helix-turn-helix transcriptional regulator [Methanohalophilus sp.]MDK2891825.1 hypothetical protein [Methanohalophilus sp.]
MIDFACKEFQINEVIKCALALTRADVKIMDYFIHKPGNWYNTNLIAKETHLDLSTVQRSVKRLHEKGVLIKSQNNLNNGGYTYIYMIKDKNEIKKIIMEIVFKWAKKVENELENW